MRMGPVAAIEMLANPASMKKKSALRQWNKFARPSSLAVPGNKRAGLATAIVFTMVGLNQSPERLTTTFGSTWIGPGRPWKLKGGASDQHRNVIPLSRDHRYYAPMSSSRSPSLCSVLVLGFAFAWVMTPTVSADVGKLPKLTISQNKRCLGRTADTTRKLLGWMKHGRLMDQIDKVERRLLDRANSCFQGSS